MVFYSPGMLAGLPPVQIEVEQLRVGAISFEGVAAELTEGRANVRISRLFPGADSVLVGSNLNLSCESLFATPDSLCAKGQWSILVSPTDSASQIEFSGTSAGLLLQEDGWRLRSTVQSSPLSGDLAVRWNAGDGNAEFNWSSPSLVEFAKMSGLAPEFNWISQGTASGRFTFLLPGSGDPRIRYAVELRGLGFDSPDGRFAGEGLSLVINGSAELAETLNGEVDMAIGSGGLLLDNFYSDFSGHELHIQAQLQKHNGRLALPVIRIYDGGALDLQAEANVDLDKPLESLNYQIDRLEVNFPEAYLRYVESMAAAWTLDGLNLSGSVKWTGEVVGGLSSGGVLDVVDLTVVDGKRRRFAVTGLDAHIVEAAGPEDQKARNTRVEPGGAGSHFSWRGLLFNRINLGGGVADVDFAAGQFALASPLVLQVLGGRLAIEELKVKMPGRSDSAETEPEIRLFASLENLDVEQLTRALDWPQFGGTVSGKIPGVTFDDGVLAVEGQIEFNVFSGSMVLSGLRVERIFGVLPSLAADLEVDDLDLQQLTSTFSFGRIAGQLSGYVHDLRMLDWKPVAFDAWFGTVQHESGAQRISRQAVDRLTKIGGGSATVALTGPLLSLFNNFSYKRLGLGCRLGNNVCEVRGLEDDAASVLIMEGAGVPKVMIRAYNRHMDWPSLVAGLSAASQGESIRVGDSP